MWKKWKLFHCTVRTPLSYFDSPLPPQNRIYYCLLFFSFKSLFWKRKKKKGTYGKALISTIQCSSLVLLAHLVLLLSFLSLYSVHIMHACLDPRRWLRPPQEATICSFYISKPIRPNLHDFPNTLLVLVGLDNMN